MTYVLCTLGGAVGMVTIQIVALIFLISRRKRKIQQMYRPSPTMRRSL